MRGPRRLPGWRDCMPPVLGSPPAAGTSSTVLLRCRVDSGSFDAPALVIARERSALRCRPIREIKEYFIDEAPTPAFRGVVAFNDGMSSGMEMLGGVSTR